MTGMILGRMCITCIITSQKLSKEFGEELIGNPGVSETNYHTIFSVSVSPVSVPGRES